MAALPGHEHRLGHGERLLLRPAFVAPDAIPWLLLRVVGAKDGPTGGHKLTATTFIQRLNTSGGIVPSSPCTESMHVGNKELVPYTADYFFFYKAAESK